jgi:hypothetical protein
MILLTSSFIIRHDSPKEEDEVPTELDLVKMSG